MSVNSTSVVEGEEEAAAMVSVTPLPSNWTQQNVYSPGVQFNRHFLLAKNQAQSLAQVMFGVFRHVQLVVP